MSRCNRLTHEALEAPLNALHSANRTFLIAVSGGPDSQALLKLIAASRQTLKIRRIVAVGIDHGLRYEAARELDRAELLAGQCAIPFYRIKILEKPQGNRLAWARKLRYQTLEHARKIFRLNSIATAHTADDQFEHLLLAMCRGRGTLGFSGMPIVRGKIWRPFLSVTKNEILLFLREKKIQFATDPNNADGARARGWLRNEIVPKIVAQAPEVVRHAGNLARWLQQDEQLLQHLAQERLTSGLAADNSLCMVSLLQAPDALRTRMLRLWLHSWNSSFGAKALARLQAACAAHAQTQETQRVGVVNGRVWIEQARLYASPRESTPCKTPSMQALLAEASPLQIPTIGRSLHVSEKMMTAGRNEPWFRDGRDSVAFDADRLHLGLWVRAWQKGDVLRPWGFAGRMRVADLLSNCKIAQPLRKYWPVVLHGSDIIWVVGLRRGQAAEITESTRRIWVIHQSPLPKPSPSG